MFISILKFLNDEIMSMRKSSDALCSKVLKIQFRTFWKFLNDLKNFSLKKGFVRNRKMQTQCLFSIFRHKCHRNWILQRPNASTTCFLTKCKLHHFFRLKIQQSFTGAFVCQLPARMKTCWSSWNRWQDRQKFPLIQRNVKWKKSRGSITWKFISGKKSHTMSSAFLNWLTSFAFSTALHYSASSLLSRLALYTIFMLFARRRMESCETTCCLKRLWRRFQWSVSWWFWRNSFFLVFVIST